MLEQSPGNFGNARVPYDWYQNSTHVIITVRIANLKENDVKVTIINDALDVMCQLLDGRQFRMHFNLHRTVVVPDSNWAVDTSKLVINLRKSDRKRWHSLETYPDKSGQQTKPKSFVGIVNLRDAKNELNSLLSAAEFESIENNNMAITITQSRNNTSSESISLDYNWYQTDNYINLVIHVPNIKLPDNRNFLFYEDDINIILTDNALNWICNFPSGVTNVNFKLFREINSGESRYEISPCRTKIEIKLRKLDEKYWPSFVISDGEENGESQLVLKENDTSEVIAQEITPDEDGNIPEQIIETVPVSEIPVEQPEEDLPATTIDKTTSSNETERDKESICIDELMYNMPDNGYYGYHLFI
ncbi:hypothetical protein BLOT_007239 [Blomia tropicalis]|nr:hypothetical protein BLOT_007239 [Blomia tropicalis]